MQEDLIQLRQAVAQAIASQKRTEQQYNQNQSQANTWQQRAQLALQKGDETLARQALERKKGYMDAANALKVQLDSQSGQVDTLKRSSLRANALCTLKPSFQLPGTGSGFSDPQN